MIVLIMGFLKWLGLVDQTVTPPPPAKTARSGSDVFLVVVDASPSMSECDMNGSSRYAVATDAIEAMSKKIEQAYPDALVGVVVFWADARVEMPLQRITTSFWKKLQGLKQKSDFGWGTSLGWGLKTAYATLGAYSHIPKRQIIALTDGHSNGGVDPVVMASMVKDAGIQIDVIGFAATPSDVNEYELRRVASILDGQVRYWFINNAPDLIARFESFGIREVE